MGDPFPPTREGGETQNENTRVENSESDDIVKNDVEKYLSGVHFPASKQELVDAATNNSAPEPVVNSMAKMPDQMYNSVDEVIQTMSGK
jgi:hypothetical protein